MSVFAEKLDGLTETLQAAAAGTDVVRLGAAIRQGLNRAVYAVGSGGSAIAAEFLSSCRRTLGSAATLVQTPLQFALDDADLQDADVWLFSAGGSNPDILGAFDAALARNAKSIHLLTVSSSSPLSIRLAGRPGASVHLTPTAGVRDGFLATHSLIAAVTALLLGADNCGPDPRRADLLAEFAAAAAARLSADARRTVGDVLGSLRRNDTLFVLQDPRLDPSALLVETCAWEAGLCAVQRTDFRNFAHGRHVWLAHRGPESFILALTGTETRSVWADIEHALPTAVRRTAYEAGSCGRVETAVSLIDALVVVEAIGLATGIDPGRPGAGEFAEALYEAPSLQSVSERLSPAVRKKASAVRLRDHPSGRDLDLPAAAKAFVDTLARSSFRGLVLDYDGTLVTHEGRKEPMSEALAGQITRLLDEGLGLAIATGRGGSAGEDLRKVLPERHWDNIVVSYYNGGHTQPLRTNIEDQRPASDSRLDAPRAWLPQSKAFLSEPRFRDSHVQLTIEMANLSDVSILAEEFAAEANPDGRLRLARSSHTVDICLADACKTTAAAMLADRTQTSLDCILCIGDSGAILGNDHALLGLPRGISVGRVCDRPEAAWSLFGDRLIGPDAVLAILRVLKPGIDGHRLGVDDLEGLDHLS